MYAVIFFSMSLYVVYLAVSKWRPVTFISLLAISDEIGQTWNWNSQHNYVGTYLNKYYEGQGRIWDESVQPLKYGGNLN